jgi:uncharacterized protein YcbX
MQSDIKPTRKIPPRIRGIHLYPVKSMGGMRVDCWPLDERGLQYDRGWMLVDRQGRFLSQRCLPRMALIEARIEDRHLRLHWPDGGAAWALDRPAIGCIEVEIWHDQLPALHLDRQIDHLLSDFLDFPCRLVRFDPQQQRPVDPRFAQQGEHTGFSDGFPLLLIGSASLDELNRRLANPVDMRRFRPNLVIHTEEPHIEDRWQHIRIGDIDLHLVKPCSRCRITQIDPATGNVDKSGPLQALATYRKQGNRLLFGQNVLHHGQGTLTIEADVRVLA